MFLFCWLAVFVLLAFYVGHSLRFIYGNPLCRVLVGPGIVLANLGRLLGCQLTLTPRSQTNCFERDGVRYERSPLPVLGPVLIATLTYVVPIGALVGLNAALDAPLLVRQESLHFGATFDSFQSLLRFFLDMDDHAVEVFRQFGEAIGRAGFADPTPLLFLYLAIAILLGSAPTRRDLRWLLLGLLVLVVANRMLGVIGDVDAAEMSVKWFQANPWLLEAWYLGTFLVSVLFGLFLIVVCVDIVRKAREMALEPELPTSAETPVPGARPSARARKT